MLFRSVFKEAPQKIGVDLDIQIAHTFVVLKIPFEFIYFWDVETYFDFVCYYNENAQKISNPKSESEKVVKLNTVDDIERL